MPEFRVIIDGLDLDEALQQEINDDIQRAVLKHLAGVNLTAKQKGLVGLRSRPEWLGIWIDVLSQQEILEIPALRERFERIDQGPWQ